MSYQTLNCASVADGLKAIRENAQYVDNTASGKCSNCGECCANLLPMTPREVAEIKRYIRRHGIKPQKHFVPTARPMYDMVRPFRDNANRRCTIYEIRPHICRVWNCGATARGERFDMSPYLREGAEMILVRETFFGGDAP